MDYELPECEQCGVIIHIDNHSNTEGLCASCEHENYEDWMSSCEDLRMEEYRYE